MHRYLLDTNILSDLVKNPQGQVAKRIGTFPAEEKARLCTSIIAAAELRYGAAKKDSPILAARIDRLLGNIQVLPFEGEVDRCYGRIRADLERKGRIISANDMLIAAHALAIDALLITENVREFERVKGLRIENWLLPKQQGEKR